jgi:AhpD family alkylhydroperoxidase
MKTRLALQNHFPDAYRLMKELDESIRKAGINQLHLELIKIRASQINGCAYCLNKHNSDAIRLGEDPGKIYVMSAWRESTSWFTEEELILLRLTEEVTDIKKSGISDEVFDRGVELFGESKFAHIIMAAISINSWNRVGIGLKMQPKK